MVRWMSHVALALLLWCAGSNGAEAAILINEVLADPAGDANGDGSVHSTRDEFVELVNTEADPLSLAHWSLSDLTQVRPIFAETASIPGRGFFVVFGGGSPQGFTDASVASSGGLGLNNTGDTITLRDGSSLLVDTFTYGNEGGHDVSLTRSPDATGGFSLHSAVSAQTFSPGTTTEGLAHLPAPPSAPVDPGPPPVEPTPPPIDQEPPAPGDPTEPPDSGGNPPPDPSGGPINPEPPVAEPEPPVTDPLPPDQSEPPVIEPPPIEEPSVPPDTDNHPVVPEPSSFMLWSIGMLGVPLVRRRRT